MNNVLRTLGADQIAVDLGCGHGSFNYAAYTCRIVGIDVALATEGLFRDGRRIDYIVSSAEEIPLDAASVDAVVCNHSLEHVLEYMKTLAEIRRVLKSAGLLWISVPNGFGFDDALYRLLYFGGGHVNRFTYDAMRNAVERATGLTLLQSNVLASGFVYCRRPDSGTIENLPRRLRLLHQSKTVGDLILFFLNGATRLVDNTLRTRLSIYGWGFVFGPAGTKLDALPSYFNVCSKCGAGSPASGLEQYRRWGLHFYNCVFCKQRNLLFTPPPGFQ